jgi:hypothetical protein
LLPTPQQKILGAHPTRLYVICYNGRNNLFRGRGGEKKNKNIILCPYEN